MGAASEKKQWTAGTVFQAAYSTGFWLFVLGNSACMFPLALSIWAVTKPFDKRKVSVAQTACPHAASTSSGSSARKSSAGGAKIRAT